jgi:hypothetical protein
MNVNRPFSYLLVAFVLVLCVSAVAVAQQNALKLTWLLSGPAIDGVVPSGKAVLNQPSLPGELKVDIRDVNLPDGTVCTFLLGTYNAGTLTLSRGRARMEALIPFQFRNGPIEVRVNDVVILTGRFKN